jgi:hypothetical protein
VVPSVSLVLLLAALDSQKRPEVIDLAVVPDEVGGGAVGPRAEVCRVFEQALAPALHFEGELGHWGVGNRFEGAADPAFDPFDVSVEGDVDLFVVKGGD